MLLFDQSLRKIDYIFRFTGMHLNNRENWNMKKENAICYAQYFSYTYDLIGAVCFFIHGVYTGKSLLALTYASPCLTMGLLGYVKSIPSVVYKKYIDEIVFLMRDLETKSLKLKDHNNENIMGPVKFLHLALKVLNYCNWVCIIAFPLMPITLTAYKYFASNEIVLLLPFYALYPFDAYDIKYWPFVVIKQIWTGK